MNTMKRHENPYNKKDVISTYKSNISNFTDSTNELNKELDTFINMIKKTITEIDEMIKQKENDNE